MTAGVATGSGILAALSPGERVFMGGSCADIAAVSDRFMAGEGPAIELTASFIPGINPVDADRMPTDAHLVSPFAFGARGSQASGRIRQIPMGYRAFAGWVERQRFDTVLLHLSPPDALGMASMGLAAEFAPSALVGAGRVLAVVNPRMPRLPHAPAFDLGLAERVFELDAPLRCYDVGAPSAEAEAIAEHISRFVPDRAALQIGLGKVPDALLRRLTDRRGLRLWSGMLSDGARALDGAGALDPAFRHESCVHVGTRDYYDWLADRADFAVSPCTRTHDGARLTELGGLVAVNGAVEVDLFGQANLEMVADHAVSGVGGAPDFARAAAIDPDGVSIIGLPSASRDGATSRIVARLTGLASLPRHDVEVVVTEHGAADLRGLCTAARAERLIAVAAPEHRPALTESWRAIARRL